MISKCSKWYIVVFNPMFQRLSHRLTEKGKSKLIVLQKTKDLNWPVIFGYHFLLAMMSDL